MLRLVGTIVKFHGKHDPGAATLAEHEVQMLLRDRSAVASLPVRLRAGHDVRYTDLVHDQVPVADRFR